MCIRDSDDPLDATVGAADDPSVAGRVGHLRGEDGDRGPGGLVRGIQLTQGGGGQQRHIAVGDEDGAVEVGRQRLQAAFDGAAGALDLVLVGDQTVGVALGDVGGDPVALMTDDDLQIRGVDSPGRGDRMVHEACLLYTSRCV